MSDAKADAKDIFLAALDCASAEDLASYLDQACAGDAALRTRVEELLAARRDAGSFLGGAWTSATEDLPPLSESIGTLIGPYKLLEQIGEGGMGMVYMADQQAPVRRRVALKVIKTGMDTRQVIARFEAERQALALMDHSNIARVLDAGATDAGRPYFVMELVRGIPITAYCDQNNLPVHERLELFIQVCQAVQHAHQKGIIHRDLKPSNVLVTLNDGRAVPKVIDFGVAKATGQQLTEKTLFTAFAQMVGTPLYMSPEQAEMTSLDIDTRSDIYSLGVLLYELLTGTTPFDQERLRSAAFDEIRRIIREEEPPKPSTRLSDSKDSLPSVSALRHTEPVKLTKLVAGDLDWIAMKCLEKDRSRRYETATGLAEDIQRYLADEPVQACPPSPSYRLRKFARRHKAALMTSALVALALLVGTSVSTWQAVLASQATGQAEAALARETNLRRQAEGRESIIRALGCCKSGRYLQAEKLISEVPETCIEFESIAAASVLRSLANWNGGEQRWRRAATQFDQLFFGPAKAALDHEEDSLSMDYLTYAPVLVEVGDNAGYEKIRNSAIRRFRISYDQAGAAERALWACLILPADDEQMMTLAKWADFDAHKQPQNEFICWSYGVLALFEHRCNNDLQALEWGQKCLNSSPPVACAARAHVLMSMAYSGLNQPEQARAELSQCRESIERKFKGHLGVGNYKSGFWKDWLTDRILLREADKLIAKQSAVTQP